MEGEGTKNNSQEQEKMSGIGCGVARKTQKHVEKGKDIWREEKKRGTTKETAERWNLGEEKGNGCCFSPLDRDHSVESSH